ncbi:MAG: NAD-dependent epimerase/dehydratase family protein [Candidatus Humimicrobiaceae bacterium]
MSIKIKKIFVAGGTGFLGKRVIKRLEEGKLPYVTTSQSIGVDFRDYSQTEKYFLKEKPDILINCAAYVGGLQFGMEHEGEIYLNNALINLNLFECARKFEIKRMINPISNCSYPDVLQKDFKENEWWDGPLHRSVLVYGFVKKANWVISVAYKSQYNFDTINFLVPNMYGPGDHFEEVRSHALGALVMKMIKAKEHDMGKVIVWGTGKPIREWLYVDDCVEAFIRALQITPQEEPINIGQEIGISIKDLAELIREIVGYNGELFYDTSKPDGAPYKIMNVDRCKEIFHWHPDTELKVGIERTVKWYYENILKKEFHNE